MHDIHLEDVNRLLVSVGHIEDSVIRTAGNLPGADFNGYVTLQRPLIGIDQDLGFGREHVNPEAVAGDGDIERLGPDVDALEDFNVDCSIAEGQQEENCQYDKQE